MVVQPEEGNVASTIILACVGMLVGTFLRFFETQVVPMIRIRLARFALPPHTLNVFLVGAATSAIYDAESRRMRAGGLPAGEAYLLGAIASAQMIDPKVILLVFLPPLIYESSSSMNYHTFRRVRWQALMLAFPGVIIQMFLVATAMRHLTGYGPTEDGGLWDWDVALTFGAIVCATDPVAVVAALHSIGAPEKLYDIIDGESLLNHWSAKVFFGIFSFNVTAAARGLEQHTWASGVAIFFRVSLGGIALGIATFYAVVFWLTYVENDFRVEVIVLVVAVYGSFAIAELGFGVSGVLTVVTLGLLMGRRGQYTFSQDASVVAEAVMPMLAYVSETLIFFVGGIAAWTALALHATEIAWWHSIPLYLGLMLVRAVVTALFFPILARTGYRVTVGETVMIVHGGLRGAVALALSLIVVRTADFPTLDKDRIQFLVGSVVVLTMAINGTTSQVVYRKLNLYPASKFRDAIVQEVMAKLEGSGMEAIRTNLLTNAELHLYNLADWEVVKLMIPSFRGARVTEHNRLSLPESARIDPLTTALIRRIATSVPRIAHSHVPEATLAEDAVQGSQQEDARRTSAFTVISHASGQQHSASVGASPSFFGEQTTEAAPNQLLSLGSRTSNPRQAWRSESRGLASTKHGPLASVAAAFGPRSSGAALRTSQASAKWFSRTRANSSECIEQERKVEIVGALFAVLRKAYTEQYEAKQLDGTALAVCMEGLSSGEEYLYDHPLASATAAFGLELDVLLYELPEPSPAWLPNLLRLPVLGRALWRNELFRRTYVVTETLVAFVHAHDELSHVCAADTRKMALIRKSVQPVVVRARDRLREHRLRYWSLSTFQINLLTARAAIEMKRKQVRALLAAGDLMRADVDQLIGALDSALYAVDTIRYSALAPSRFHRKLKLVLRQLDLGSAPAKEKASVLKTHVDARIAAAVQREPSARGDVQHMENGLPPAIAPHHSALGRHRQHHHERNSHVHFAGEPSGGDS